MDTANRNILLAVILTLVVAVILLIIAFGLISANVSIPPQVDIP